MTLLLFATIILVVAVITVVGLLADLRFRRLRPTRIADCRDGQLVKVVGRAVAIAQAEPTTAPFSGRPCVAWRISATLGHSKNAKTTGRAHIDKFIVTDDRGEAIVDPAGVSAFGHGHLRLNTDFDAKARWETVDATALPGLALLDLLKANQATEAIVAVGERIAVRARVAIDPETRAVRLIADRGKHMVLTDQPRLIGRS